MIFLGLFIFFVCMFAYLRHKSTAAEEAAAESFWNRENEANHTRRKDISGLPYITIPLADFPMGIYDNPELKKYEETLQSLAAEVKLEYGVANLETLCACDENYTTLCRTIYEYAECLKKLGHDAEAVRVLEYGISCGSDHSGNYRMLADYYLNARDSDALDRLLIAARALESPRQNAIVAMLEEKVNA
mgnify:CR=1 FL=1